LFARDLSLRLSRKRIFAAVQDDPGKIIDVVRRKLSFITVQMGNVSL
jgi:hypothetical protein